MAEQILDNLFRIEVPLPKSPLKALNSYLIKGEDRFLIIDTGMNREACLRPMLASLKELGVDLNRTDFFITHLHADHMGNVANLATESSKIYFSHVEASVVRPERRDQEERRREMLSFYVAQGFPEEELNRALMNHPGYRYSPKRAVSFTELKEGDLLEIGDFAFECIETPGHSPGHMCLYEARKKILVCGDHILFDITPNITNWPELPNSLKAYLESLDKVYPLDVKLVLTGHRSLLEDHRGRIRELKEHHKNRLKEVLVALEGGDKTAWDVAPHITWDIDFKSWEDFPPVQKWFAMGETLAHIHYLEAEKKIRRRESDGKVLYCIGG